MLGLIRAFPLLATVVSAFGSTAIVGGAFWIWNRFVDNPGIVREQRAICVSEVEGAAARARMEEERRQFEIALSATQRAAEEEARLRAEHESDIGKLTQEIKQYEAQRSSEGRSCPLSGDDILFLERLR